MHASKMLWAPALLLLCCSGMAEQPVTGCRTDIECKGTRICVQGMCVEPGTGGGSGGGSATAGGSTAGGSTAGGSTAGGSTAGGSTAGGAPGGGSGVGTAYYPLEILNLKTIGAPPQGMSANSRLYRAYPGIPYNYRAGVIGGVYPYHYALANAPAGMTIDANTGTIDWASPQSAATPTLTVTDQAGTQRTVTWTINVGTAGFRFIDAVNGADTNAGTRTAPWRTVAGAKAATSPNDIWYFRTGVYRMSTFGALQNPGTSRYYAAFSESESVIWLGYPGESPILDYEYAGNATTGQYFPCLSMTGGTIYVDNFELRNTQHFFFITGGVGQGPTFRRLNMHHQAAGWIETGSNSSFLMYEHNSPQGYGAIIQDCEFSSGGLGVKHYDVLKPLIADNVFHGLGNAIEEKAGVTQFTIRGNNFYDIGQSGALEWAIGGNMNTQNGFLVSGEVAFNLVRMNDITDEAYHFNWMSNCGTIYAYRNTFVGRVTAISVDSADGPFTLTHNVIVNTDTPGHIYYDQVSAPDRVIVVDNLMGAPAAGIVDANGELTQAYSQWRGQRGHR